MSDNEGKTLVPLIGINSSYSNNRHLLDYDYELGYSDVDCKVNSTISFTFGMCDGLLTEGIFSFEHLGTINDYIDNPEQLAKQFFGQIITHVCDDKHILIKDVPEQQQQDFKDILKEGLSYICQASDSDNELTELIHFNLYSTNKDFPNNPTIN